MLKLAPNQKLVNIVAAHKAKPNTSSPSSQRSHRMIC